MAPDLGLSYSQSSGNGPLGVGWRLRATSSIRRCPRTVAVDGRAGPVEHDHDDVLCLGSERLVLIEGAHLQVGAVYLERDNDWTRVELVASIQGDPHFRVTTDDQRILYYGLPERPSRRDYDGVTYEWLLSAIEDRFGNRIEYDYTLLNANFAAANGAIKNATLVARLDEIRYTVSHRDDGSFVPASRSVQLFYKNRSDTVSRYYYGALQLEAELLDRIETHAPEGLIRSYQLDYDASPSTGYSRLTHITECDGAGACLPPTELAWQDGGTGFHDIEALSEEPSAPVYSHDMVASVFLDIDGNGNHELLFIDESGPGNHPMGPALVGGDWKVWNPRADLPEDSVKSTSIGAFLPDNDVDVDVLSIGDTYEIPLLSKPLSRTPSAGNFDSKWGDDIFVPLGFALSVYHATSEQDADEITFGLFEESSFAISADFVADFDGDGFTDVLGCGDDGAFVFSLNRPGLRGARHFESVSASYEGLPCNDYTHFLFLDADGDGATEAMVAPPEIQYVDDAGSTTNYHRLDVHASACADGQCPPQVTRVVSTLPFDHFQRWRDETCMNAYTSLPVFSGAFEPLRFGGGLGNDKIADFNGDGLLDVLRFNVAPGAGESMADVIEARFIRWDIDPDQPPPNNWAAGFCRDSEDDRSYGLELFVNTGDGFREGQFIWSEIGDPHRAYWHRFVPSQIVDHDSDGKSDLIMPSPTDAWPAQLTGSESWQLLQVVGGLAQVSDPGLSWDTTGTIDPDETWFESFLGYDRPNTRVRSRAISGPDVDGDGRADLVFIAGADTGEWPMNFNLHVRNGKRPDLLTQVTDGLGRWVAYEYTLTSDEQVIHRGDAQVPRARTVVRALVSDPGPVGEGHDGVGFVYDDHWIRVREHEYMDPVISPRAHGLVGFERTRVTESVRRGEYRPTEWDPYDIWVLVTESRFDLQYAPRVSDHVYAGRPTSVTTTRLFERSGSQLARVEVRERQYELNDSLIAAGAADDPAIYSVRTDQSTTRTYEVPAAACPALAPAVLAAEGDATVACRPSDLGKEAPVTETSVDFTWDEYDNMVERLERLGNGIVEAMSVDIYDGGGDPWWPPRLPRDVTSSSTAADGDTRSQHYHFSYDFSRGVPLSIIRAPEDALYRRETVLSYSAQGNLLGRTAVTSSGDSREREYVWDADGYFLASQSTPGVVGSGIEYHTHGGLGVVTHTKGPHFVASEATYDGFGRITGATRRTNYLGPSDGGDVSISYLPGSDFPGAVMRVRTSRAGARVVTSDLDRLGRTLRSQWAGFSEGTADLGVDGDVFVVTQHDPRGLVRRTFGPYREGESLDDVLVLRTYDGAGRIVDIHRMDGAHTTYLYAGRSVMMHDPDGRMTVTEMDGAGMVVQTMDDHGVEMCLDRGVFGKVVSVRRNCGGVAGEPSPAPSQLQYDDYGRLVSTFAPETGWLTVAYNQLDEIRSMTDANGDSSVWNYDATGRVQSIAHVDGATQYFYHPGTGRLLQTVSVDGVVSAFDFDLFGRPSATHVSVDGELFSVTRQYDAFGRLQTLHYPSSVGRPFSVQHSYDPHGYLSTVHDDAGQLLWRATSATAAGQLEREHFGGTVLNPMVTTTRTYDQITRRLEEIRTEGNAGALLWERYSWTRAGDLEWKEAVPTGLREEYDYDGLHRLTTASVIDAGAITISSVTYNALGDITSKTGVGDYFYDDVTRRAASIGGVDSTYDANGNLVSRGGNSYVYSPRDTIRSMTTADGVDIDYDYDAFEQRVRRTDSTGMATIYVGGGLYERTLRPDGTVEHRYRVHAWDKPVAEVSRRVDSTNALITETRFLHGDYRGSLVLATDSAGAGIHRTAFDPWGHTVDPGDWVTKTAAGALGGVNLGFTGHEARMDGELLNFRGRMYDPDTARFASPDPILQSFSDLRSHNRYSYVWNRPTVFTDPSGYVAAPAPEDPASDSAGERDPGPPPGEDPGWDEFKANAPEEEGWSHDYNGGNYMAVKETPGDADGDVDPGESWGDIGDEPGDTGDDLQGEPAFGPCGGTCTEDQQRVRDFYRMAAERRELQGQLDALRERQARWAAFGARARELALGEARVERDIARLRLLIEQTEHARTRAELESLKNAIAAEVALARMQEELGVTAKLSGTVPLYAVPGFGIDAVVGFKSELGKGLKPNFGIDLKFSALKVELRGDFFWRMYLRMATHGMSDTYYMHQELNRARGEAEGGD